jgi:NDP-sugar pyrophosphorylase family protein
MQALILAGGEGTRLRPLTINTPKPIVPIANEPFLLRQIESIKKAGITDITLALNYQPSAIEKILGDGADFGVHLRYLIEPAPLGTAGAYKFAEAAIGDTTLILNGDILTDVDLTQVIRQHRESESAATIVLTEVENPAAYGLVECAADKSVLRFLEKPNVAEIEKMNVRTINAGIYILEPHVLKYIPDNEKYSFEYQLFPQLLERNERFQAFTAIGNYWLDIGTPERYLQANRDAISGRVQNAEIKRDAVFYSETSAEIDDKSVVAADCVIKNGAKIYNSVLGKNVIIGERSVVRNSVIWSGCVIGADCVITDSVTGYDCRIGSRVTVKSDYLADETKLSKNQLISSKSG